MYSDLWKVHWWNDMKKYTINFVDKCRNCQKVPSTCNREVFFKV